MQTTSIRRMIGVVRIVSMRTGLRKRTWINVQTIAAFCRKLARGALRSLDDQELNQLFAAVVAERLQRGMKSPVPDKIPNKRSVEATAVSLTPGKLSAVRAAFKAGVTPTKIAKEFGLSQADVRSVIASDKR